jgi:pyruvate/2-oxoglutarate dehydrogenase complex dihydrolipoamide dehydrogenase (E3) component
VYGGVSRQLTVPGAEFAATHSDAWALAEVPESMIVVGAGMTGLQVASVFNAFGSRVQLLQSGSRILSRRTPSAAEMTAALRAPASPCARVRSDRCAGEAARGRAVAYSKDGVRDHADATLVVVAIGWAADTAGLTWPRPVSTPTPGVRAVDDHHDVRAPTSPPAT